LRQWISEVRKLGENHGEKDIISALRPFNEKGIGPGSEVIIVPVLCHTEALQPAASLCLALLNATDAPGMEIRQITKPDITGAAACMQG
jgi:hypothetical protein